MSMVCFISLPNLTSIHDELGNAYREGRFAFVRYSSQTCNFDGKSREIEYPMTKEVAPCCIRRGYLCSILLCPQLHNTSSSSISLSLKDNYEAVWVPSNIIYGVGGGSRLLRFFSIQ